MNQNAAVLQKTAAAVWLRCLVAYRLTRAGWQLNSNAPLAHTLRFAHVYGGLKAHHLKEAR